MNVFALVRLTSAAAVLAFGTSAFAASADRHGSAAEVRAVLRAQEQAWNRGDIDGFMDGYARSERTLFISGGRVTSGWNTVRDRYRTKYDSREKMGRLTFSHVKVVRQDRDGVLVTGKWKLRRSHDRPHGRFELLFRQTPDGWRIVRDETTSAD